MTITKKITCSFELPREYKKCQEFLENIDPNEWKEDLTSSMASYTMKTWNSIDLGETDIAEKSNATAQMQLGMANVR